MRERKNIHATEAGIALISLIKEELLKSAKLTGIWENKLRRIERGDYSVESFIEELKMMIAEIVHSVMHDPENRKIVIVSGSETEEKTTAEKSGSKSKSSKPRTPRITKYEQIVCPECGEAIY